MSMSAIHIEVTCQSYTASVNARTYGYVANAVAKAVEECTKLVDEDLRHMQQTLRLTVKILSTTTQVFKVDDSISYIITLTLETKG